MQPDTEPPVSNWMLWAGWIITVLPVLALLVSGTLKLIQPPWALQGFRELGYPESTALGIGIVELACAVIYVIPRTSVLGAILLTGYLGGATATHVRVGEPFFAPIVLGVLVWGGLYLRDARIRALIPLLKEQDA